ncbi:hypothetical protein [Arcticibacterium luteifluviistationis]|uniref:Uncharacterized protein n=1 Tax=Arcticibacterium luteifluviistationis TaxID=1784714 RepID=A0A2Z4GB44_9BACT|nr:hypothetical protein [Arcticibacterium luteifluviistationis]AWV98502.1 hypothetical protein DJ013_10090 [Arcticibacterium luteifluviistationis]
MARFTIKRFFGIVNRKKEFEIVADQTCKIFEPNELTIVWACPFAGYKRSWLLLKDLKRFNELTSRTNEAIQVIFDNNG